MTRSSSTPCTSAVLMITIFALFSTTSLAKLEYVTRIPNGAGFDHIQGIGHTDWIGGGLLNDFGKAFAAAGYKWTFALCKGDADGDGQTNGDELGDPCCVWKEGDEPVIIKGLSHPGDPSSILTPDDQLINTAVCRALEVTVSNRKNDSSILIENSNSTSNDEGSIVPGMAQSAQTRAIDVTSDTSSHYRLSILCITTVVALIVFSS